MKSAARSPYRPIDARGLASFFATATLAAIFGSLGLASLPTHAQASAPSAPAMASSPVAVPAAAPVAAAASAMAASGAAGATPAATAAPAEAPAAAAAPSKPDLAKGQAIATQVCAACHAVDGSRGVPAYPILQGQHPEYLVKQLTEFKAGVRENAIMKAMALALSEADMKNVAAFYASKQAKPGFAKSKEMVTLGEKIYRGGIAEKSVPACAACHSPTGSGLPVKFPRIGGQFSDYTEAQLTAFRSGARHNGPMMMTIASRMSDAEIKAVADYITGLQRLAVATPAP